MLSPFCLQCPQIAHAALKVCPHVAVFHGLLGLNLNKFLANTSMSLNVFQKWPSATNVVVLRLHQINGSNLSIYAG